MSFEEKYANEFPVVINNNIIFYPCPQYNED
jgi:hypothetical protein